MIWVSIPRPLLVSHTTVISSSDSNLADHVPLPSFLKIPITSLATIPHRTLDINYPCAIGSVHLRVHGIITFLQSPVGNDGAIKPLDGSALERMHARSILRDF